MGSVEAKFFFCVIVVDVEADLAGGGGGGGWHGGSHVLRYVMDFRSAKQCIKIGNRVYYVLR